MADYAQSPYAGIRYFRAVQGKMGGERVRRFMRLYTAPGVDHVGSSTRNHKSLRRRPLTRRWWTFDLVHTNGSAFSL